MILGDNMKKIKNLDYLLSFAVLILLFASISLVFNDIFEDGVVKSAIVLTMAVVYYLLSLLFRKLLNVDLSSKVSYSLGCLNVILSLVLVGSYKVFGSFFSFYGDGVLIFLASISILIGVLALLTMVLYKNYNFIHIVFASVIFMLIFLLSYFKVNYLILMIIVSSILLLLTFLSKFKSGYEFSNVAIYISSIINIFLIDGSKMLLSSILFVISTISLVKVLLNKKSFEYELMTVIVLSLMMFFFVVVPLSALKSSLALIIAVGIVCLVDLAITTFRGIDNKIVKILYKVFNLILLSMFVGVFEFHSVAHLIAVFFIIISSIVDTFAIHNDDYEKCFLPFKLMFLSYYLVNFVDVVYVSVAYAVQALIYAFIYRLFKSEKGKGVYATLIGLSLICMVGGIDKSLLANVISIVSLFVSFVIFKGKESDRTSNILYAVVLISMLALTDSTSFIEMLILVLISGIFSYIFRHQKLCFGGSMFVLLLATTEFISLTIKNFDICLILTNVMYLIFLGIVSEVWFINNHKAKNVFAGIFYTFVFLRLLGDANSFITLIFCLIFTLSIILVSINKEGYKSLFYVGLVFGLLYLLDMFNLLEGLPASLYLLLIAVFLIVIVSIMLYRAQKNKDVLEEAEKEKRLQIREVKSVINYCSECGNKLKIDDVFCSECGNKVR